VRQVEGVLSMDQITDRIQPVSHPAGMRGCDLAFHVLERYAEAELNRTGPGSRFPGVAAHLRRCEACHQDYQGLLAAVEGLRARPAREMTVMGASAAWSDQRASFALADRIGPGADV